MINSFGSLPEKALQTVPKEVLTGIHEIQSKLCKSHGNIASNEIIIDAKGTLKVWSEIEGLFIFIINRFLQVYREALYCHQQCQKVPSKNIENERFLI